MQDDFIAWKSCLHRITCAGDGRAFKPHINAGSGYHGRPRRKSLPRFLNSPHAADVWAAWKRYLLSLPARASVRRSDAICSFTGLMFLGVLSILRYRWRTMMVTSAAASMLGDAMMGRPRCVIVYRTILFWASMNRLLPRDAAEYIAPRVSRRGVDIPRERVLMPLVGGVPVADCHMEKILFRG